jgi:hypothetical protein
VYVSDLDYFTGVHNEARSARKQTVSFNVRLSDNLFISDDVAGSLATRSAEEDLSLPYTYDDGLTDLESDFVFKSAMDYGITNDEADDTQGRMASDEVSAYVHVYVHALT